ncbi:hypothetical protein GF380_01105 [Candidatus Uhrbacteria bacterium]|nr:hypothetical protein [Candidatus Uhrbacteria bacterium]
MSVIRTRIENKGKKAYVYHEFTVRYSAFEASKYAQQEAILESVGKANLTEFIMQKIAQDSLVEEIKTALRDMLDRGELIINTPVEQDTMLSGNAAILGFLRG